MGESESGAKGSNGADDTESEKWKYTDDIIDMLVIWRTMVIRYNLEDVMMWNGADDTESESACAGS